MIANIVVLFSLWKRYFTIVSFYEKFLFRFWPIVSYHKNDLSIMNLGFSESNGVSHISTFCSKEDVILSGEYPENCLYWSLVFYDTIGRVFASVEQSDFPLRKYEIIVSQKQLSKQTIRHICPPTKYFSVIQRIYSAPYTTLFPQYLPCIEYSNKGVVYDVTPIERVRDSMEFQKSFQTLLSLEHCNIPNLREQVNLHQFFLPGQTYMERFFLNPQALILFAFPKRGKIMKIKGTLPNVGCDSFLQYISFMTCDFSSTVTDDSISYFELPYDYEIFISDNQMALYDEGYDYTLLWNPRTKYPVVVMYIILSSFQSITPRHFLKSDTPVDGSEIREWFGEMIPQIYHE